MTKEKLRHLTFLNEDIERLSDIIQKCDDIKTNGYVANDKSKVYISLDTFNDEKVLQAVCSEVSDALSLVHNRLTKEFEEA